MGYTIDIDVGGTFTDCFVANGAQVVTAKVPTTRYDLSVCFTNVIESAAEECHLDLSELLSQTDVLRYSTTIGTNALIERSGPKLGLITTRGFEDTIFIGRARQWADGLPVQETRELARIQKPQPLIGKEMVVGVRERVDCFGQVVMPLQREDVIDQVQTLVDRGARGFVVCLLWSFLNPTHEQMIRDIIQEEYPDTYLGNMPTILSSEISPRSGEYTRTMTAVVNAFTHPELAEQLWALGEKMREAGYTKPMMLVHNTGGSKKLSRTKAINTHSAGPVAGIYGAAHLGRLYGVEDIIVTDMGGTSFDIGVVVGGEVRSYDFRPVIDRWRIQTSIVETKSIGAGGGSIAWFNPTLNRLEVGPRSAGAMPGPAAYDQGGEEPTVTDADVVLGYIDPDYYLGGRFPLNAAAARQAIQTRVAHPLGLDPVEAAWHIRRLADGTMGQEIFKEVALKGFDPRNFALFAAGGAGPTHCCDYNQFVGAERIMTFPFSSVFCAYGAATMDIMHIYEKTRHMRLTQFMSGQMTEDYDTFNGIVEELTQTALRDFRLEGFAPEEVQFALELDMRYGMQLNFTRVRSPRRALAGPEDVQALCDAFNAEYARLFSPEAAFPQAGIDVEEFYLKAWVSVPPHDFPALPSEGADPSAARKGSRPVYWRAEGDFVETPVFQREALRCGNVVEGPAVIEAEDTTIVVPPSWRFSVDDYLNGVIEQA
ncbi:MAG: hydantoinase/oxoprolinase family protein [Anaerolineae bacterium]